MNRAWSTLALIAALLLASAGCWYGPAARDVDPLRPDVPQAGQSGPRAATPRQPSRPPRTNIDPTGDETDAPSEPIEPLTDPEFEPTVPVSAVLPGGLRAVTRDWPAVHGGGVAHLDLLVPTPLPTGSGPGIAELVARLVADAPIGADGQPPLREFVEDHGGRLSTDVDNVVTSFAISVPTEHWRACLRQLVDAVGNTPTSPQQIRSIQDTLVAELTARYVDDPVGTAVRRVIGSRPSGVSAWLHGLQDLNAPRIATFHRSNYRPDGAVVGLLVPGVEPAELLTEVAQILSSWPVGDGLGATPSRALPERPRPSGVFWGEAPGRSRIALVTELPDLTRSDAATRMVALECLTWSGVGGRLGRTLERELGREVGFERGQRHDGASTFSELRTEASAEQVLPIYAAVVKAARSLAASPPAREEVATAAARVRMRLLVEQEDAREWLRTALQSVLAGGDPDLQWTDGGLQPVPDAEAETERNGGGWSAVYRALAEPDSLDLTPALRELASNPPFAVVIGGTRPEGAAADGGVTLLTDNVPAATEVLVSAPERQVESGSRYLDLAVTAVGGLEQIAAIEGYESESTSSTGRGPDVHDREWFLAGRKLRRVRQVLATTIESVLGRQGGMESSGGRRLPVPADEALTSLDAAARHPLFLLRAYARGQAAYRLVSLRPVGDRQMAVLERIVPRGTQLRLHVDSESGLVRTVESQERRTIGNVYVREDYRDYRNSGGLRVPFHRTTSIDDAAQGVVTTWHSLIPRTPEAAFLEPGGPVK